LNQALEAFVGIKPQGLKKGQRRVSCTCLEVLIEACSIAQVDSNATTAPMKASIHSEI
jgi:hypothetical protein